MKRSLIIFSLAMATIISSYALNQEFIKPKTKKVYVSEQQDIELDGELIMQGNRLSGILIEILRALFLTTQAAITRVNNYACGQKEAQTKVERTEYYAKKAKIKEKIEKCIEQLEQALSDMNALIASLDQ